MLRRGQLTVEVTIEQTTSKMAIRRDDVGAATGIHVPEVLCEPNMMLNLSKQVSLLS